MTDNNFSESYLYDRFNENYKEGLAALNSGNQATAKYRLTEAAEYMSKLALVSNGKSKEEWNRRAKKLMEIVQAIPSVKTSEDYQIEKEEKTDNGHEELDSSGMEQFFTFYDADSLTDGFSDVVGLEQAKEAVTEYVILPRKYPEAYNYDFLDNRAILLEGPPGTGKTTFAKAVAKEIDQPFALINVASLINCYVGETGKNIDRIFEFLNNYANEHKCGITVFMDELDEIAKQRGGDDKASEAAVPALLRNLDGVKRNKGFLIIANTNRKDTLDKAVAERFRKQIYIPLPDAEARVKLFKAKLKEVEQKFTEQIDFDEAAKRSEGLSGRDITFICDDFKHFLSQIKAGIVPSDAEISKKILDLIETRLQQKN